MTHSMQQQLALRNLQKEAMLMSKLRHPNGECRRRGWGFGAAQHKARGAPACPACPPALLLCNAIATGGVPARQVGHPPPPPLPSAPNPRPTAVCLYLGAVTNPPCLVMEYCAKCSLDHLLRAGLTNQQVGVGCTAGPPHQCHTELGSPAKGRRGRDCCAAACPPAALSPFHSFPHPSLTSLSLPWPRADGQTPHLGAPSQHGPGRSKRQAARPPRCSCEATCTGCVLCTLGGRRPDSKCQVPACDVARAHAAELSAVLPVGPPPPPHLQACCTCTRATPPLRTAT